MWYRPFEIPLRLTLTASPSIILWIIVWALLALTAVLAASLSGPLTFALAAYICVYALVSLLRLGCFAPAIVCKHTTSALSWDGAQQWRLCNHAGEWLDAGLVATSWNSEYLLILHFQVGAKTGMGWSNILRRRRVVLVTADNCNPDDFRRLRARLKWGKVPVPNNFAG